MKTLNPFECWMVRSNLQYIPAEGLELVVNRLRDNGYPNIAEGVIQAHEANRVRNLPEAADHQARAS